MQGRLGRLGSLVGLRPACPSGLRCPPNPGPVCGQPLGRQPDAHLCGVDDGHDHVEQLPAPQGLVWKLGRGETEAGSRGCPGVAGEPHRRLT